MEHGIEEIRESTSSHAFSVHSRAVTKDVRGILLESVNVTVQVQSLEPGKCEKLLSKHLEDEGSAA